MIQEEQFRLLLEKYMQGECNEAEIAWLEHAYLNWNEKDKQKFTEEELEAAQGLMWLNVSAETKPAKQHKLWPRYAGIAAAVIGVAVCVWFYQYANTSRHPELVSGSPLANDIAPGKNTATLTVNGKQLQLSDAKTGILINANNITYNDGQAISEGSTESLTITTPRGGTYQTTLSDGTKIWLNADSKLEFLSNYRNKLQRIVKLTGEGYFEVAKDASRPFIVQSNGQDVTVLGTHFNISAYNGEAIRTTLLEGSVRVLSSRATSLSSRAPAKDLEAVTLKPNQQAILKNSTIERINVDAELAVAWKNNKFIFANQPIQDIMRMVARWYNVEVIYPGAIPDAKFRGSVSRFDNVSKVLRMLESTGGAHFKIEDRKIYVYP